VSIQFFESSHRYKIDGEWATSVTTALKGIPKDFLTRWAAKEVATYALNNLDQLAGVVDSAGYGPALSMLSGIPNQKRDHAAVRGTEVHALAEKYIAGEAIEVDPYVQPYVDGYAQYITDWNPVSVHEELMVASRKHMYAGRLDSIQDIPARGRALVDYKTSSGVYGEYALQCAAYRHAEVYVDENGDTQPMLPVDEVLILHIQRGTYDLIPVQADEEVFEKFLVAKANYLANVQSRKLDKLVGEPIVRAA
jgi:hypothetical protein